MDQAASLSQRRAREDCASVAGQLKPHVCEALRSLHRPVWCCALVLGLAICAQMLVWAFANFTDVRFTRIEADDAQQAPLVVQGGAAAQSPPKRAVVERQAPDPNLARSAADHTLAALSGLAVFAGTLAALGLLGAMFLGVTIAAGGAVPGVEKASRGFVWAVVAAALALPLRSLLPSFPLPGALLSYEALTQAVEAHRQGAGPGALAYFSQFVAAPLTALALTALAALRFSAGVEAGLIATSVSELDEALEREMASIKLASTRTPKTVGALNRAIGDHDDAALQRPETDSPKAAQDQAQGVARRPI